jgi:hypothetical protein
LVKIRKNQLFLLWSKITKNLLDQHGRFSSNSERAVQDLSNDTIGKIFYQVLNKIVD